MPATAPLLVQPIRRYPITSFAILACLFGWIWFPLAALGIGSNPSNMPWGPITAALIVAACQGRGPLASWGRRLIRWRARPGWYALAFLTPIALGVLSVAVNHFFGAPLPTADQLAEWPSVLVGFLMMLVYVGLGEEAAWIGFAAPILLRRHGLLGAWAVLGGIRIFWHLPIMLSGELPWELGIPGMISFQLIVLWLMQVARGQWTLAAVWHASLNASCAGFLFPMVIGADNARLGLLLGIAYAALGAVCLTPPMRRLANRRQDRLEDLPAVASTHPATVGRR